MVWSWVQFNVPRKQEASSPQGGMSIGVRMVFRDKTGSEGRFSKRVVNVTVKACKEEKRV